MPETLDRTSVDGHSDGHSPPAIVLPEPNSLRLQNRQAVVAPRLVGSPPAPLSSRSPCKLPFLAERIGSQMSVDPTGLGNRTGDELAMVARVRDCCAPVSLGLSLSHSRGVVVGVGADAPSVRAVRCRPLGTWGRKGHKFLGRAVCPATPDRARGSALDGRHVGLFVALAGGRGEIVEPLCLRSWDG
jgi:hypothetical protein